MTDHTPGPWEYVPSNEHHGPYVAAPYGGDICDCYVMSDPSSLSVRNGGPSKPIHLQSGAADANARLIAAAPCLLDFAQSVLVALDLAAELDPDNVINYGQFSIDARAAITKAKVLP